MATAKNTPSYKVIIDYPDADGTMRKVNEYDERLPYEMIVPRGTLLMEVVDEKSKDVLIDLAAKWGSETHSNCYEGMTKEEIIAETERIRKCRSVTF